MQPNDLSAEALKLSETHTSGAKTDGQLLARFLQNRDEHAFEELVKRHSRMVMATCKRVLGDVRDAEEAFQNTFLVLLRKAGMHLQADSIGGWLYNVATRTALDIRGRRLTQSSRFVEQEKIEMIPQTEESVSTAWEAMKGLLDEELVRLADKYRQPLILCYLEGKATDEAATELGMNHNTFRIRLMRGRELLRKRLIRRGVTVSANLMGTVLLEQVAQSAEVVSEVLIQSTVKAATALLSTTVGVAAIITATAASKLTLLKGIVMAMMYKKAMLVIGGLVLLGLLGSIAYWSQGKHKSLAVRPLPAIVAHKQPKKLSEALTAQTGTTEQISDSVEKTTLPGSIDDFLKRFAQGLKATGAEKWKIWRQLGIGLTDEEFEAAWAEALKSERFKDISKSFKGNKTTDPRCALLGLSPDEVAMFLKLQDAIFSKWVDKNPLAAVEWCKGLLAFPPKKGMERSVFYMNYGREGLMPERESLSAGSQYNLLSALIACWGPKDISAATKWAQAQLTGLGRDAAMVGVALALSRENPAEATKLIEKENIRFDYQNYSALQNEHLVYIFSNWALHNRAEAIAYLTSLPRNEGPDGNDKAYYYYFGMNALGYQWAKTDLSGALQWTETLSDVDKNSVLGAIIDEWAKKDFAGAANYVTALWEHQDSENNSQMLWSLAIVWLEKDPQACVEWALHLTDKYDPKKRIPKAGYGHKENILHFSCQQWAVKDHKAAFQWAENIPSDPLRKVALESVMGGLVSGAFRDNEFANIQECVTLLDEANVPEAYRRSAYQNMVLILVQKNSPNSAMEWIRTLPNGDDKDVLISMCCTSDTASFPDQMQWASEMQGNKYRTNITKTTLLRWCKSNVADAKSWAQNSSLAATADKWIQESSLPQSVKDKWLAGK